MTRYMLVAIMLFLTANSADAARQGSRVAACIETGDIMRPVCGTAQVTAGKPVRVVMHRERRRAVRYTPALAPSRPAWSDTLVERARSYMPGVIRAASGATARVAASATGAFQCLVDRLEAAGYPVRFMGGWRARGSVRGSLHPAGLALDVNQLRRNVTRPAMPSNEIALANGCGLVSGAQWAHGDSGHFQLGGWAGGRRHYASRRAVLYQHYASAP